MDVKCERSQMVIPIDLKYLEIASQYTGSVAEKFGLNEQAVKEIRRATEQTLSWVIDYSFEETDRGFIDISCEIVPEGFKITLKDKGLPLNPSQPDPSKTDPFKTDPAGIKKETPNGLSDSLLPKTEMDEIRFNNLGPKGKEIVLIKHSKQSRITDHYQACELNFYDDAKINQTPVVKIHYTVRPLEPGEEIEVSKCIYQGYGYTYPYEHVYYPEKLIELNKSNMLFSVVAATQDNEIAGHCALRYDHTDRGVGEIGLGVVKPKFRAQGCFERMVAFLLEKAKADRLLGIYVQAVTVHTYSQQVAAHYKMVECAAFLAYLPAAVTFKGVKKKLLQRDSVMASFIYFNPPPTPWDIYPPAKHKAMIQSLYDQLKMTPHIKNPPDSGRKDVAGPSGVQINIMKSIDFARIKIETYGQGIVDETRKIIRDLCLKKIEVINVYINLSHPFTPYFSEKIEEMGCFFAGLLPGAMPGKEDALIFQYLNNVEMDYEKIKLNSPQAKRLLDYIKRHDPHGMGL